MTVARWDVGERDIGVQKTHEVRRRGATHTNRASTLTVPALLPEAFEARRELHQSPSATTRISAASAPMPIQIHS
jgi:hypothetical protein